MTRCEKMYEDISKYFKMYQKFRDAGNNLVAQFYAHAIQNLEAKMQKMSISELSKVV